MSDDQVGEEAFAAFVELLTQTATCPDKLVRPAVYGVAAFSRIFEVDRP